MKIAIASGKGGTGKTTLATNLAAFLAETEPVVLVDLDVEEPNTGLFVRGAVRRDESLPRLVPAWDPERCSQCGLCQEVCNFNAVLVVADGVMVFPELCHACHACAELCPEHALRMVPRPMGALRHAVDGNLDIVEGRLLVGEVLAVPLIARTLAYVEDSFPRDRLVILDSPPGTACPVVEAARAADLVVLVTEPTPFGLHDLDLAVQTMRHLDRDVRVVVNRDGLAAGDPVGDYCAREGIEIIARIPDSRRIAEIYASGRLIYREAAAVADALTNVVDVIHGLTMGREA